MLMEIKVFMQMTIYVFPCTSNIFEKYWNNLNNYCNSLFIDITDKLDCKVTMHRPNADKIVLNWKKYDSVTPHLMSCIG